MLKRLAKYSLGRLPKSAKYEIFYNIAKALGIRAFLLDGRQGMFVGAVADRAIMRTYLLEQEWSHDLTQLISEYLGAGGTFLDVGANIGLISLKIAALPGVKVIALEPDEENHSFLKANIALHARGNVLPLKLAAWSEETKLRFSRNNYNSGDHHIEKSGNIEIHGIPLDNLEIASGPLVIKIDTQGAEPAVLKGAKALLARADLVICEFWPWGMQRMGQDAESAINELAGEKTVGCVGIHGKFGDWMDSQSLAAVLRAQLHFPDEYRSVDVAIRPMKPERRLACSIGTPMNS